MNLAAVNVRGCARLRMRPISISRVSMGGIFARKQQGTRNLSLLSARSGTVLKPLSSWSTGQQPHTQPLLRSGRQNANQWFVTVAHGSDCPATSDGLLEGSNGPSGDLFDYAVSTARYYNSITPELAGKRATIRRTFGPRDSTDALLTCGGEELAAHASFDPNYHRAQSWIRHHPVGPAVLSPILLHGLTGALVEATFPQGVAVEQSMKQNMPLIVGSAVEASIEVTDVERTTNSLTQSATSGTNDPIGHKVRLRTKVVRSLDDAVVAEGEYVIWIPDYHKMS